MAHQLVAHGRLLLALIALGGAPSSTVFAERTRLAAVTFDDLPQGGEGLKCQVEISGRIVEALKTHGIPAVAFVNEGRLYVKGELDARIAILREWVDADLELGNHTFSHHGIDGLTLPQYQEEVIRGETVTRMLLNERNRPLRYFRHTQLRTGPTTEYRLGLSRFLRERGYTVAPVTVDTQDYMFAAVYADAKHRDDADLQSRVVDAYRVYVRENFDFHELDPAYGRPEPTSRRGWSWIQRWILAEGGEPRPEPREPEWVTARVKALRRATEP